MYPLEKLQDEVLSPKGAIFGVLILYSVFSYGWSWGLALIFVFVESTYGKVRRDAIDDELKRFRERQEKEIIADMVKYRTRQQQDVDRDIASYKSEKEREIDGEMQILRSKAEKRIEEEVIVHVAKKMVTGESGSAYRERLHDLVNKGKITESQAVQFLKNNGQ